MTWDREEALWLANNRRGSLDASMLKAAVSEIDRLNHAVEVQAHHVAANITASEATIASLTADRDHWRAARQTAIEGGDILKEECDRLRAKHNSLHQQLTSDRATAQQEIDRLRARVDDLLQEPAAVGMRHQLDAAQQRIAELEAEVARLNNDVIIDIAKELDEARDILRAIYPVYRASKDWQAEGSRQTTCDLASALDTARAALTPELIAALKAAGCEDP